MPQQENNYILQYKIRSGTNVILDYCFVDSKDGITLHQDNTLPNSEWTKLEHEKCTNCTLVAAEHPNCPAAENLSLLINDCEQTISFETVELEVVSRQRTTYATTSAQRALSSLVGLVMATSECPHTQFFRPMAQFHLPLSSQEETTYRAISTYLLTQFLKNQQGQDASYDLSGLVNIYNNMHTVNLHMSKRIKNAIDSDTAINAMVILDTLAITLPNYLEEELNKLSPYFSKLL